MDFEGDTLVGRLALATSIIAFNSFSSELIF